MKLYLEASDTSNWLHDCNYHPVIRRLSRVGRAIAGLQFGYSS